LVYRRSRENRSGLTAFRDCPRQNFTEKPKT
jgi:hypothetical protein